jgi:cytochrome c peroxidase
MSDSAKRGALLFYGKGRCAACHAGPLLTDQLFHNIGVPQLGPGVGDQAPLDIGRALITGRESDRFTFRTPSLRNVDLTGPWMHNGAYTLLDNAIRHYRDPAGAHRAFDPSQLDPRIASLIRLDQATQAQVMATLDTSLARPIALSEDDVAQIRKFLKALTDPRALIQLDEIPDHVPSGLPVFQ